MSRNYLGVVILTAAVTSTIIMLLYALFINNNAYAAKELKQIRAEAITIVDGSGNSRIHLFARDEQAGITLYDSKGRERAVLLSQSDEVHLKMLNSKGDNEWYSGVHENRGPSVNLIAKDDQVAVINLKNDSNSLVTLGLQTPVQDLYGHIFLCSPKCSLATYRLIKQINILTSPWELPLWVVHLGIPSPNDRLNTWLAQVYCCLLAQELLHCLNHFLN